MDEWETFNETLKRRILYQCTYKDFEVKNLGKYHDLYLKSDTWLLVDVFESFREMCLKIHHLDAAKIFSASGLAWQVALKNTDVKLK